MMSMRRKIAGLKPDQIRQLPKEELDLPVSADDFVEAIERCNKSVSQEDLEKYEKWMSEFGSSWYFTWWAEDNFNNAINKFTNHLYFKLRLCERGRVINNFIILIESFSLIQIMKCLFACVCFSYSCSI